MNFRDILTKFRQTAFSERDKGNKFEELMKRYLISDPTYNSVINTVYLWNEFPFRSSISSTDIGIDLVVQTHSNEYWAVQCKCYNENTSISKHDVDSFLSTSSRAFFNDVGESLYFTQRLWISTTNSWSKNAEETLKNQQIPLTRVNLYDLENAPIDWELLYTGLYGDSVRFKKKELFPHQKEAVASANEYFQKNDRGKLIMACGTGKTFTSLKIAEKETENKGLILFLVPSIALLGQTLKAWCADSSYPINPICICSDPKITRVRKKNEDNDTTSIIDLAYPASTNPKVILNQLQLINHNNLLGMTVVFSTYQSIDVIANVQKVMMDNNFPQFDLIICDEAHRTTGVTLTNTDESTFVKVHNNEFIKAKKRLYMTATPRLYSEDSKKKAEKSEAILCSMDDNLLFGEEIYRIGFGRAVEENLLTDYKVLILTLGEDDIPISVQNMVTNEDSEIDTDDASKLIGCINALSKHFIGDNNLTINADPNPMKKAVAFCQNIKISKKTSESFNLVSPEYNESLTQEISEKMVSIQSKHMDGTMSAPERDEMLSWLKADTDDNECRVITNVKVLSEGVDVPSLDSVMFLSAKNSQVDVVQSVGRVMRKAPNKQYGYIIIPIFVPNDVKPSEALNDNKRYKVVWSILNALRAHDDRFNATVNKIELNKKKPDNIIVGTPASIFDNEDNNEFSKYDKVAENEQVYSQLTLNFEELQSVIYAKLVEKVGDRTYWESWAKDVADIAKKQIREITRIINDNKGQKEAFNEFLTGLQKNINPSVTEESAIEMLAQHTITEPIFESLFENYSFVKNNAVSMSMQKMIETLEGTQVKFKFKELEKFYASVHKRTEGIDNAEGKQAIIIELYDKFFKTAFPKMAQQLGIVYTPIEVVDFIINSVNDILLKEFNRNITDENIHILDPFTGTGTFITRLLQSGLIKEEDIERKYKQELHANEIVLLAYYIAAVNIENAYHDITSSKYYSSFDGICLTDTFQLSEKDKDCFSNVFPANSERVEKQQQTPIQIIIGNPPYSVGQKSANDNAQNQSYPKLDKRIEETYVKGSNSTLSKALYDSYIKAFRWATDRIGNKDGIISFVSNGAWLSGNSQSGFRKSIENEFSSIYIFDLRGNQRTSGELSRKEGGKIFGSGSRTPITITLLVKKENKTNKKASIKYYDIGDYLSRNDKLKIIKDFKTMINLPFKKLSPNIDGDWLEQRNPLFDTFIPLTNKKNQKTFFKYNFIGVSTNRDAWVYNFSKLKLSENTNKLIDFYNFQLKEYIRVKGKLSNLKIDDFISTDGTKIKWTSSLKKKLIREIPLSNKDNNFRIGLYRPFCKEYINYYKPIIERPGQSLNTFPNEKIDNLVIITTGKGSSKPFSVLISNKMPDLQVLFNGQLFPLYYYKEKQIERDLFNQNIDEESFLEKYDGISDYILQKAKLKYNKFTITKEQIFFYIYGILHSNEYKKIFLSDLRLMLPKIPLLSTYDLFMAFYDSGKNLANLHLYYEGLPSLEGLKVENKGQENYKVKKMKFLNKEKKDTIIYNSNITISNIPIKAYEYQVNGRSAIEWIMERYQIKKDKDSGIINDPNDWALEENNPRYILDLLLSVINMSVKTVEIINNLPKLDFS